MENFPTPQPSNARMAGVIAMYFGVQALFVAGSYYFPHYKKFAAYGGLGPGGGAARKFLIFTLLNSKFPTKTPPFSVKSGV